MPPKRTNQNRRPSTTFSNLPSNVVAEHIIPKLNIQNTARLALVSKANSKNAQQVVRKFIDDSATKLANAIRTVLRLRLQYGEFGLPSKHPLYIRTQPEWYLKTVKLSEGLYGHARTIADFNFNEVQIWITGKPDWFRPKFLPVQFMTIQSNGRTLLNRSDSRTFLNRFGYKSWENWLGLSIVKAAYAKYRKDPIK